MRLQRPQAFAGFLVVGLLALVGFAAFSATGARTAPPVEIPADFSARVAGALLGVDLGPDAAPQSFTTEPTSSSPPAPTSDGPEADSAADPTATVSAAPTTTTAPSTTATSTAPTTTSAPTTTAAPATTTTAASPYPPGVVGGIRDVEEWRPLVEQYFAIERVDEALSVMECESQGNPLAQHPETLATGLFQFIPSTWAWASEPAGFKSHSAFEPEANVAAAAWLVAATVSAEHPRGPWAHWSCQPAAPAE